VSSADRFPPVVAAPGSPSTGRFSGGVASSPPVPNAPSPDHGGLTSRWKVVAVCVLVFVALVGAGVGAFALFGHDDDATGSDVADEFDGPDTIDGLGSGSGTSWQGVSGTFGREAGRAVLIDPNPDGPRSITVSDVGATNATIAVTAGELNAGWGIVFRYAGPFNYWFLQAVPGFAVLNVARVADGVVERVGATALVSLRDGMEVEVRLEDTLIEVWVEGQRVFATTSEHGLGATRAGLFAAGDAGRDASWEAFAADPDVENPGPREVRVVAPSTSTSTTVASTTPTTVAGGFGVVPPSSAEEPGG